MRNWFGIGKRKQTETILKELATELREINLRLNRMEEANKSKVPQISIQTVHIHQPVLKSLEFSLDALDIENLSGSLNLGNNFGVKTGLERLSAHQKITNKSGDHTELAGSNHKEGSSKEKQSDSLETGLHRTSFGFRFKNN